MNVNSKTTNPFKQQPSVNLFNQNNVQNKATTLQSSLFSNNKEIVADGNNNYLFNQNKVVNKNLFAKNSPFSINKPITTEQTSNSLNFGANQCNFGQQSIPRMFNNNNYSRQFFQESYAVLKPTIQLNKKQQQDSEDSAAKIQAQLGKIVAGNKIRDQQLQSLKNQLMQQKHQIKFLKNSLQLATNTINIMMKTKQGQIQSQLRFGRPLQHHQSHTFGNYFRSKRPNNYQDSWIKGDSNFNNNNCVWGLSKNPFRDNSNYQSEKNSMPFPNNASQRPTFADFARLHQNHDTNANFENATTLGNAANFGNTTNFGNTVNWGSNNPFSKNLYNNNSKCNMMNKNMRAQSEIFDTSYQNDDPLCDQVNNLYLGVNNTNTNSTLHSKPTGLGKQYISNSYGEYQYSCSTFTRNDLYILEEFKVENKYGKIQFLEQLMFAQKPSPFNIMSEIVIHEYQCVIGGHQKQIMDKNYRLTLYNFWKQYMNSKIDGRQQIKQQAKIMGFVVESINEHNGSVVFLKLAN